VGDVDIQKVENDMKLRGWRWHTKGRERHEVTWRGFSLYRLSEHAVNPCYLSHSSSII